MTVTHHTSPAAAGVPQASVDLVLTRLVLDPRHPATRRASRDVDELHKLVMSAYRGLLIPGADNVRERLKILYAAQRPPSPREDRLSPIGSLLVQSQATADWNGLVEDGVVVDVHERRERYTFHQGQRVALRTWACPVRSRANAQGGRGKPYPVLRNDEAAWWMVRTMGGKGVAVDTPSLLVGEFRRLGYRGRGTFTIRPYQFQGIVTDPQALAEAVANGIGKGRAYGAGLLSLQND